MRRLVNLLSIAALFTVLLSVGTHNIVSAYDPYNGLCQQAETNSGEAPSTCTPVSTNPLSGDGSLLSKATNIVSLVAGIVAVVMLMFNGVKMMLSSGDTAKFTQSRTNIIWISVGIVVIILARTIIRLILERI